MKTQGFLIAIFLAVVSPTSGFAQEPTWTQEFPAQSPSCSGGGPMAYDSARQQGVLFTGCGTTVGETWIWDGNTWTQKFPATSPPARISGTNTIVYDSVRSEVVLFGGATGSTELNDTWVWDGTNWTQKFPTSSPPPRAGEGSAYDAARQQSVLFGGVQRGPVLLGDTWVWDGSNWTQKFPAHSPSARNGPAMAYDATRQQVVLFGGSPCIGCAVADTWVWDGTDWAQKSPSTNPPVRYGSSMAYDIARQQILLFGGVNCVGGCYQSLGDTWVWDGTNWTQKFPAGSPSRRGGAGMAGDSAHAQVVLFGGSGATLFNDTWVWGTPFAAQVQPPINADGSSVFNSKRGVVPVKFTLPENGTPTCNLPSATISLFRTSGGTPGSVNESAYIMSADNGSNFRVSGCQYVYNLGTSLLGVGTYQVNISISGIGAGTATFGLD
jgi:hypothetical protein